MEIKMQNQILREKNIWDKCIKNEELNFIKCTIDNN